MSRSRGQQMQQWGRKALLRAGKLCPILKAYETEKHSVAPEAPLNVSDSISGRDKNIYHFLCRAFGQCVTISQIIDFNILDVVAIRDVNFAIDVACALTRGRRSCFRCRT